MSWDVLSGGLDELRALIGSTADDAALCIKLNQIVPEYRRNQSLTPLSFPIAVQDRIVALQSEERASVGNPETGRVSELGALS